MTYNCTRPVALVDRELCKAMEASIFIAFYNEPRWCITNTKVEHLASLHKLMQAIHQLWNASREVPPVNVEQIEIARLKSLDQEINTEEKNLETLKASSSGLQKEADTLQSKIDDAGGEKLKKKKLIIADLQEVNILLRN